MPAVTSVTSNLSIPPAPSSSYVARAHGHIHRHHDQQHQTHSHGFAPAGTSYDPLVVNVTSPLQTPSQNVA